VIQLAGPSNTEAHAGKRMKDYNTEKVMSRDRNVGRGHSVQIDSSSIERVEEFKYLGKTLTNQNSIQEEIMSRLKLGNA